MRARERNVNIIIGAGTFNAYQFLWTVYYIKHNVAKCCLINLRINFMGKNRKERDPKVSLPRTLVLGA